MAATAAETKALEALSVAHTEFLNLKAASYNAQKNAYYDKLATNTKAAYDGLKAETEAAE